MNSRAARRVLRSVFGRIGREMLATLAPLVVLVLVTALAGVALGAALKPAVEAFFAYLIGCVIYAQTTPTASGTAILASLAGTVVFLALDLVVVMLASGAFVGKVQKIFPQRVHDGVPLGAHRRFWIRAPLALALCLARPYLVVLGADPLVSGPVMRLFIEPGHIDWRSIRRRSAAEITRADGRAQPIPTQGGMAAPRCPHSET